MELDDSLPSGVLPGGVCVLMTAAVMYDCSQLRGTVSSNLALRLDRLQKERRQRRTQHGHMEERLFFTHADITWRICA